jgi:hypothetical protein
MTPQVPEHVRKRVVARVYADATKLDWPDLSIADRSRQYSEWLDDPEVGGLLEAVLGRERARVWLKDGPLKEYARALAGVGPYAPYLATKGTSVDEIVRSSVGSDWSLVPDSSGIKPLHCLAGRSGDICYIAWGPSKDFKHLLWACLMALDGRRAKCAVAAVTETLLRPTPGGERARHARIADRCGITVWHIQVGS